MSGLLDVAPENTFLGEKAEFARVDAVVSLFAGEIVVVTCDDERVHRDGIAIEEELALDLDWRVAGFRLTDLHFDEAPVLPGEHVQHYGLAALDAEL